MSDYNWPEEVAYVNAVDFSADQRLAEYHPRAVTANGKSAYRQKIQLLGNDKLKIFDDSDDGFTHSASILSHSAFFPETDSSIPYIRL